MCVCSFVQTENKFKFIELNKIPVKSLQFVPWKINWLMNSSPKSFISLFMKKKIVGHKKIGFEKKKNIARKVSNEIWIKIPVTSDKIATKFDSTLQLDLIITIGTSIINNLRCNRKILTKTIEKKRNEKKNGNYSSSNLNHWKY